MYQADCVMLLPLVGDESVDTVFADPPFNLGKTYGAKVNDRLEETEYITWCKQWIDQCIRVLKPGGSFFLYNIPRWNVLLRRLPFGAGPHVPALDRRQYQVWTSYLRTAVPLALWLAVLLQGKAEDLPKRPDPDQDVPALWG